ncbi:hypothetical protein PROPHIGD54-1_45 [Mycobacterium phage prophiGD54-1]|nr:hypothetical protein PROPHIGD102-2_45 [Mycobacterium phage prophi102-2]QSM04019.1 hypothetical protein PROPHIGD54-1_45 [Mycobacterium phage prophiGD54-1]SIN46069.1 Uncharacterised protein [Mycobacteroides abscessus subsp. abscessus]
MRAVREPIVQRNTTTRDKHRRIIAPRTTMTPAHPGNVPATHSAVVNVASILN